MINAGESYYSPDGKEWQDTYFDGTPENAYNLCIKAFTVNVPTSNKGSGGCDALSGGVAVLSLVCLVALRSRRRRH